MQLLTLIDILENKLQRGITNYQGETVINYTGNITKITVNSEKEYTNVYQVFLTHDDSAITVHINHSKNNHTSDYNIENITSFVITWKLKNSSVTVAVTEELVNKTLKNAVTLLKVNVTLAKKRGLKDNYDNS